MRPSKYATPGLQYKFSTSKATSGFVIIKKCCFKSRSYGSKFICWSAIIIIGSLICERGVPWSPWNLARSASAWHTHTEQGGRDKARVPWQCVCASQISAGECWGDCMQLKAKTCAWSWPGVQATPWQLWGPSYLSHHDYTAPPLIYRGQGSDYVYICKHMRYSACSYPNPMRVSYRCTIRLHPLNKLFVRFHKNTHRYKLWPMTYFSTVYIKTMAAIVVI